MEVLLSLIYRWGSKDTKMRQPVSGDSFSSQKKNPVPLGVLALNNFTMFPNLLWSREYLDDQILLYCDLCPPGHYGELLFPVPSVLIVTTCWGMVWNNISVDLLSTKDLSSWWIICSSRADKIIVKGLQYNILWHFFINSDYSSLYLVRTCKNMTSLTLFWCTRGSLAQNSVLSHCHVVNDFLKFSENKHTEVVS